MDVQLLGADDDSYDAASWTMTTWGGSRAPATRLGRAALGISRWMHRAADALARWAWGRR